MKLSLILLLVLASVALFKAEELPEDVEELTNDEESSVSFLYDGSMEDEVLGDEDDPADKAKKQAALSRIGERRVCGRVFIGCLRKTKARCKLIPVCKVKYFACRCVLKGVRKCKKFLHFVRVMAQKHKGHKHDEVEEDEEDPKRKRRRMPKFVKLCKAGFRRCARGKKFCGGCLRQFGACIRRHVIKKLCSKKKEGKKSDEPEDDEESIMADAVENDEDETETEIEEEDDGKDLISKKRRPNKKIIRCAKYGVRCMLRARLNCRRQGRCVRRVMKCVRRARRRPRPTAGKQ
ncbi:uncharacterized protein LOC116296924 [Actinia tenebrosa]|uniref:Uncharacterized protein LOC116296924 n=1 Tax=Actinia tenebrosa TaxID=6105 RepID=A0A6P8HWX7_ACTTE|nr:uncharacterized protein LOC116296924 [Actinia tenebrosa]